MYKSLPRQVHSYLSPKCEARQTSKISRWGLFAKAVINKGELITIWGGSVITLKQFKQLCPRVKNFEYPVQVYPGLFFGPTKAGDLDQAEMVNHSCSPNAGIKGQNILVARRNIKAGEEITYDYETTDTENMRFRCRCGSKNCRKIIDGNSWKNPEWRRKNRGYLSWYITEKIKKTKLTALNLNKLPTI